MAKSVTNSGHCKALEQLQNDRYKLATEKYFETEHKRFHVEPIVLILDCKSSETSPILNFVMLVMFSKTLASLSKLGGPAIARAV